MENYPVPLILKCIVSGQEVKYYSRPYIETRIKRAGDLATLINTFMAKSVKKKKEHISARTWKGAEIIKSVSNSNEQVKKPISEPTALKERVYKYSDGSQCRVNWS